MLVQGKKFRVWFLGKAEYDKAKARHDKTAPELSQGNGIQGT